MKTINTISIFGNKTVVYTAGAIYQFSLIAEFEESEFEVGFNKMRDEEFQKNLDLIRTHFNYKIIDSGKWYIPNKTVFLTEEEIQEQAKKWLVRWIKSLSIIRTLKVEI